jgi:hypothetical protein
MMIVGVLKYCFINKLIFLSMKKKVLYGFAMLLIVAIAVANFNIDFNTQRKNMSEISLANIEALAGELPEVVISCDSYAPDCFGSSSPAMGQCWTIDRMVGLMIFCRFSGYMSNYCCWNI